jgi:crotonobetainyl-CoA:carnitine CoA-transferase CaiB-like acyl-CoA transferase
VGNDGQWQRFCTAAGRSDLLDDERFVSNQLRVQYRDMLVPMLEEVMRGRKTREWEALLLQANVPHAPVWDYSQLFAHDQTAARGLRVNVTDPQGRAVDLVGTPFHIAGTRLPEPTMPPRMGEHTDAILGEILGIDNSRLADLRQAGIIG